jgi:TetR/AcrR family transcriptional repressor of lmrAB and yxaGH operons
MLDAAARLFRSGGYHATGLNQLVAFSGAPKGSLYFHFPGGKEQLAAEAMREAAGRVLELLGRAAGAAPDAAGAVAAVLDQLADELVATDFRCGCPLATVALDAGDSEAIRGACAEGYRSWRDSLAGLLRRHGIPAERSAGLAVVTLAAIEGALLLARTERDVGPMRQVREHLAVTIAAATRSRAPSAAGPSTAARSAAARSAAGRSTAARSAAARSAAARSAAAPPASDP